MDRGSLLLLWVAAAILCVALGGNQVLSLDITRAGCNVSKLCLETPAGCDPNGTSSCLFTSAVVNGTNMTFELRGDSAGYVAVGLTNSSSTSEGESTLFVCAQNSSGHFFIQTMKRNNSDPGAPLTVAGLAVTGFQGQLLSNVIKCVFTVPLSILPSLRSNGDTVFRVLLGNGSVNGSSLGVYNASFTAGPLDLAALPLNITRAGCKESKLCLEAPDGCDLSGTGPCLFTSTAVAPGGGLTCELRGDSTGYVAAGLTSSNKSVEVSWFQVCGQKDGFFFSRIALRNNSVQNASLINSDLTVTGVRGEVKGNVTKCVFLIPEESFKAMGVVDRVFSVTLGRGAVNGSELGSLQEGLKTSFLKLTDPKATSAAPATGRIVCPTALLSALILSTLLTFTLTN